MVEQRLERSGFKQLRAARGVFEKARSAYEGRVAGYQSKVEAYKSKVAGFESRYSKYIKRPRPGRGVPKAVFTAKRQFPSYKSGAEQLREQQLILKEQHKALAAKRREVEAKRAEYLKAAKGAKLRVVNVVGDYKGQTYVEDWKAGQTRPLSPFEEVAYEEFGVTSASPKPSTKFEDVAFEEFGVTPDADVVWLDPHSNLPVSYSPEFAAELEASRQSVPKTFLTKALGVYEGAERKVSGFIKERGLIPSVKEVFPILSKDYERGLSILKRKADYFRSGSAEIKYSVDGKPVLKAYDPIVQKGKVDPVTGKLMTRHVFKSEYAALPELWYKGGRASGEFLEGMFFSGPRDRPLLAAGSFGVGAAFGYGGQALSATSKSALFKLASSSPRGHMAAQVITPLASATTQTAKAGLLGLYGYQKYEELKASKDRARRAGQIFSTEITPFVVGSKAGYAGAKASGLTRKDLVLESKIRTLGDPSGQSLARQEKVWSLTSDVWRSTIKPGGYKNVQASLFRPSRVFPDAKMSKGVSKKVAVSLEPTVVGGSGGQKALLAGRGVFKQADTLKVKISPLGDAKLVGPSKKPSDVDFFARFAYRVGRSSPAKNVEKLTRGRLPTDVHPMGERLYKPFAQKPQLLRSEGGGFQRVARGSEQLGGTAEGMTQVEKPTGLIKGAAYKFLRTDLFVKPGAKGLSKRVYPSEFYRLGKDYPSTVTMAEQLVKYGRGGKVLSKSERVEALKLVNQLKIDMTRKQWASPSKAVSYTRPSVRSVGTYKSPLSSKLVKSVLKKSSSSRSKSASRSVSPSVSVSPSPSRSVSPSRSPSPSFSPGFKPSPSPSPSRSPSPSISPSPSVSPSPSISPSPTFSPSPSPKIPTPFQPTGSFIFKPSKKAKTKPKKVDIKRAFTYKPSLVALGMKAVKGKAKKKVYTGGEIRRVRL